MAAVKELKKIKVPANNIQMGMYIAGLDRPWTDSPFLLQGFVVSSKKVLAKLQQLCEYVYVDSAKSVKLSDSQKDQIPLSTSQVSTKKEDPNNPYRASKKPLNVDRERYKRPRMTNSEMRLARESYKQVQGSMNNLFEGVTKNSSADPKQVDMASETLVSSAVSYPSSLSWLALIQKHNNRVFDHSLRTTTWALLCGRHIGLSETDLKWLAIGTMLKDLGQLKRAAKKKEGMTPDELAELSVSLAKVSKLHPRVIEVIAHHRERFNGTGKPKGLEGEEIPLLARITTIATAYDLALNPFNKDREPKSPSQAARMIYAQRGRAFQEELAIQFIEALGTYPLGTILQLDTGEVAVVVDQDEKHRLKPRIMIVTDEAGQPIEKKRIATLGKTEAEQQIEHMNARVMKDLSFSAINLNMSDLLEEYDQLQNERPASKIGNFFRKLFSRD